MIVKSWRLAHQQLGRGLLHGLSQFERMKVVVRIFESMLRKSWFALIPGDNYFWVRSKYL
jgi:hypothetical protein